MRRFRSLFVAILLVALFAVPSTAAAQIDQFSLSPDLQLGPEGGSTTVVVTVQCTEGYIGFLSVSVLQNKGGRLASGFGAEPVECTGEPQTVSVPIGFSIFALKQGKATATATLDVFNPETGEFATQTIGPITVRVHK